MLNTVAKQKTMGIVEMRITMAVWDKPAWLEAGRGVGSSKMKDPVYGAGGADV
jgi:hypothetical protein